MTKVFLIVIIMGWGFNEKYYEMPTWDKCIEALDSGHFKAATESISAFCIIKEEKE